MSISPIQVVHYADGLEVSEFRRAPQVEPGSLQIPGGSDSAEVHQSDVVDCAGVAHARGAGHVRVSPLRIGRHAFPLEQGHSVFEAGDRIAEVCRLLEPFGSLRGLNRRGRSFAERDGRVVHSDDVPALRGVAVPSQAFVAAFSGGPLFDYVADGDFGGHDLLVRDSLEPVCRLFRIFHDAEAVAVDHSQLRHGLNVSAFGGHLVPADACGHVPFDTYAAPVHVGELHPGAVVSAVESLLEPFHRFFQILRNSHALAVYDSQHEACLRVPVLGAHLVKLRCGLFVARAGAAFVEHVRQQPHRPGVAPVGKLVDAIEDLLRQGRRLIVYGGQAEGRGHVAVLRGFLVQFNRLVALSLRRQNVPQINHCIGEPLLSGPAEPELRLIQVPFNGDSVAEHDPQAVLRGGVAGGRHVAHNLYGVDGIRCEVLAHHRGVAGLLNSPVLDPNDAIAHLLQGRGVVGRYDNRLVFLAHLAEHRAAFRVEAGVAHGQDLVEDQDVAVDVDQNREGQLRLHPGGVHPEGMVDLLAEFRELNHAVHEPLGLALLESVKGAFPAYVVPAGELRIEPDAELQDAGYLAVHVKRAGVRMEYAGYQFQERGLP